MAMAYEVDCLEEAIKKVMEALATTEPGSEEHSRLTKELAMLTESKIKVNESEFKMVQEEEKAQVSIGRKIWNVVKEVGEFIAKLAAPAFTIAALMIRFKKDDSNEILDSSEKELLRTTEKQGDKLER